MRTFVEFNAKGGRRLYIDSAAILGVMTHPNRDRDWVATPDDPILLMIRNAEPVEIVGTSALQVFIQMSVVAEKAQARKDADKEIPVAIEFIETPDAE